MKVFFCPSNAYFTSSTYWWGQGSLWYSGYCYWGNYIQGTLTPKEVAQNTGHDPYSVLISDIVVTTASDSAYTYNSHPTKGLPEGGNYVYNDGHAKWKWRNQMKDTDAFVKAGVKFYF